MSQEVHPKYKDNKRQFHNLLKRFHDLGVYQDKIESFAPDDKSELSAEYRALQQLGENTQSVSISEKHYIQEMLRRIDSIIASRRRIQASGSSSLPTVASIRLELQKFHEAEQPVVEPPYPNLCGALPLGPDEVAQTGSFVCVHHEGQYILGYILWHDEDSCNYHVCDPDPEGDVLVEFVVPASRITALPTSSPSERTEETMYKIGSKVLALWPDENGTWTSVFYRATVTSLPTGSPGWYTLQFEATGEDAAPYYADVPERYVVLAPPDE